MAKKAASAKDVLTNGRASTALRVLATAVSRDLTINQPSGVLIYGRTLEPSEIWWLFCGMTVPTVMPVPRTASGETLIEDTQICGTLLGTLLPVRVLVFEADIPGLLAEMHIAIHRALAGAR